MIKQQAHDAEIVNQFSKQAIPFAQLTGHRDSMQLLVELSKVSEDDSVLDVACGPGLVACEFAKIARHVTGIDLTETMIEQAKLRQMDMGLTNLSWDTGNVLSLPYESNSFAVVVSRYSFHHFLDHKAVLMEMIRVCKHNGMVLIADVALPKEKVDAYNRMEKLRDPSHIKALSLQEWEQLLGEAGLRNLRRGSYQVTMELEKQLEASFPKPGDDDKLRHIFRHDIGPNCLGVDAHWVGTDIHFSYPISVYVGTK
ncbi:class I SAM-dependent methyltransferase [Methylomarinum vadi]|uniref:class I SAM-dependent methyltransferase n=1 Tax=Methylomarinum vadi TaxID=438855 RepID=UPI0004DFCDEE|nr:methyltransferase domain-containing protein [Methylomarinum vadi]